MPDIISRADAKAAGLRRYFTGEPCYNNHVLERSVKTNICVECSRIICARYRRKDPEIKRAKYAALERASKEKRNTQRRARYAANPDPHRAKCLRWYKENKDVYLSKRSAWRRAHPAIVCARSSNRRAKIRSVEGNHTGEELRALLLRQKQRCANSLCKRSLKNGYHADHIIPLCLGGNNGIKNIQLLCAPCNLGKGAKHPIDWAQSQGALL